MGTGTSTAKSGRAVRRFEAWALQGNGRIQGVFPLPEGQPAEAYVELETEGEVVVEIREHLEGYPDPLVRKPAHDAQKRLKHSDYVNPSLGLKGRNSYEYDARGLLKARQDADTQGKVRFRFEVTCNDQGRIVEERQLDSRGRFQSRWAYRHDDQGRLIEEQLFQGPKGDQLVGTRTLAYDERGRLARRVWRDGAGQEKSAFQYKYDAAGRRTEIAIEAGGVRTLCARFEWDEQGRRKSMEVVDERRGGASLGKEVRGEGKVSLWIPEPDALSPEESRLVSEGRYAEVAGISPQQIEAMAALAYSHLDGGRADQARRLYQSLALLDPQNPLYMAGVATASMACGQTRAALNWFDRALVHDASHVPSLAGKAEAHLALGEVDGALSALKDLFTHAKSPTQPELVRARAMLQALTERRGT